MVVMFLEGAYLLVDMAWLLFLDHVPFLEQLWHTPWTSRQALQNHCWSPYWYNVLTGFLLQEDFKVEAEHAKMRKETKD